MEKLSSGVLNQWRQEVSAVQLWTCFELLEKIIYKNKNQHRTCIYFRKLLLVRRLLREAHKVRPDVLVLNTKKELFESVFYMFFKKFIKWLKCTNYFLSFFLLIVFSFFLSFFLFFFSFFFFLFFFSLSLCFVILKV